MAKRVEKDPLADAAILKDFFKSMWKVLVICDMLFRDIGKSINWEYCVLDSLQETFWSQHRGGLMGVYWVDYEIERSGYPDEPSRFNFYEC